MQRRFSPRTAVSALALAFGLTACASHSANAPGADGKDVKADVLLKVADETSAGGDAATAASLYRQLHALNRRAIPCRSNGSPRLS